MHTSTLDYSGKCNIRLVVNIHGTSREVSNTLVDTGFIINTGYGLKLPIEFRTFAKFILTGHINLANGQPHPMQYIPQAIITHVEGQRLQRAIPIPTIFMTGAPVIGMLFLQLCIIHLDGPDRKAMIEFDF